MDGPIITVDVSKGNCHYQPWLTAGHSLRKPKVLNDTKDGFEALSETIEMVKEKSEADTVPVVFEATGILTLSFRHCCLQLTGRRTFMAIRQTMRIVPISPKCITRKNICSATRMNQIRMHVCGQRIACMRAN